jgi:D-alanyl-D-alanine carboxypeptidase
MSARRVAWLILSILSCLCLGFGPATLTDGDVPQHSLTREQMRAMRVVPPPQISAASAIMVNTTTGQVLFAQNEHARRAPGSLVKLVTAMVALQRGRLDKDIWMKDEDVGVGSAVYLQAGERLSLGDLLYMVLIPSDNAAAMAVARGVGRDVPTFVNWMNELVNSWGLKDTHFGNPSGLDHKEGYSTAYDMAIIAYRAMGNPTIAEAVRRQQMVVQGRWLESTNKLLNTYSGTIGVKTGTTDRAGECLAAWVDRPAGKVLVVVMGSQDRFLDARLLLDYFYANYAELRIELPQTPQNRYLDADGNWHEFGLRAPVTYLVKPWQANTATFYRRIDDISPSPAPDKPIGMLEVRLGDQPLTEVPIYVR